MRNFLYILIFILVASCTSNTIFKKPDDLISKEEMVNLLTDLYIATAAKNVKNENGDKKIDYTFLVFDKYGIDTTRFSNSNFYYTTKIDEYEAIYKKVEERIKSKNKEYKGIKKIKDSIRKDSLKEVKFTRDSINKIAKRLDSIKQDSVMRLSGIINDSIKINQLENFEKVKDSVLAESLPRGRETIF